MNQEEILKLQESIKARSERFHEALTGGKDFDKALANLTGTDGWELIEQAMNKLIADLLEPDSLGAFATHEAHSISCEARRLTIIALRSMLSTVRSAAAGQVASGGESKTEGVSE